MKRLFLKIFILLIAFFILDFLIGVGMDQVVSHSDNGRYYKARYSLEESTEDVIILGSSRAETNYVPHVIEEKLGLSCWTTGRGGQILPFWNAMGRGVVDRYNPKIIIVNVEPYFLEQGLSFEKAGFLRPFYRSHPEIHEVIDRISPHEKFLLNSRLYAYNSSFYYLLRSFIIKDLDGRRADKGWKPRIGKYPIEYKETQVVNYSRDLNQDTVAYFESFINGLKGSKIYIVISPDFSKSYVSSPSIEYLKKLKDITLINLGEDNLLSSQNEYYRDPSHLNKEGAILFTRQLCDEIMTQN